ncbi:hypothetical protein DKM19_26210 [Streptosporangium sp. 'caverna']|nr:hypothetical protein DKM19_26210 [Streptosporangium sp. 'caverna']
MNGTDDSAVDADVPRSAFNPRAVEITRASIERHVGRHRTDLLPDAGRMSATNRSCPSLRALDDA